VEIEFYPQMPDGGDIDERNVVFEDGHYQGDLIVEEDDAEQWSGSIETIELFLGGDTLIGHAFRQGTTGYHFRFEDERNNETTQPFQLLYDILFLSIRMIRRGEQEPIVLYSRYMACISKQPEDTQNAVDMLKSLLNFEDDRIGNWMFGDRTMESLGDMRLQQQTFKSPTAYIQLIESIAICYQSNLQYFNALARHSIKKTNVVREYAKARDVSITGFQWLMQNSDQLVAVPQRTALLRGGKYYIPRKILMQEPVSNRDVYENQVILSFLMLVLKNARVIQAMLAADITERESTLQKIQGAVREGYQPPAISTIWQLPLKESKGFCERLSVVTSQLESLYNKYNEILQCSKFDVKTFPQKTKTFQEVKPYSQVFEQIMKWFKFGDFDMKKNRVIFNLRTLDKLFEYYSLYRLLKMLSDAGFEPVKDRSAIISYRYHVFDSWYENERDVANTYHLKKDNCQLTLYYQPVVHSDRFENDLTIFRTTIPRRNQTSCYYTPDFLLKITREDKAPVYVVLDSKYSNRTSILRRHEDNSQTNYLDKIVLKYSSQFATMETRESPKMIWILQGRVGDGDERSVFRFHNSPLAKYYPPSTNYGVISVNTKTHSLHELWNEIRRLGD
jgi:succinate dehydrogenase flavin-adding protein (antitoxin of CptAB toxin-antitoxin module)